MQLKTGTNLLRISSKCVLWICSGRVGSWIAKTLTTMRPSSDFARATLKKRVLPKLEWKKLKFSTVLGEFWGINRSTMGTWFHIGSVVSLSDNILQGEFEKVQYPLIDYPYC